MKRGNRGAIALVPLAYYLAAAAVALALAVPNLNPFHAKPAKAAAAQVDLLAKQQAELDAARAEVSRLAAEKKAADDRAETARQAADAKRTEQLKQGQQYVLGTGSALGRVDPSKRTPEIRIASDLNGRAAIALGLALGDVSPDKQAEIIALVDSYIAGKEADVKAQLDAKDREVQAAQAAKVAAEEARTAALTEAERLKGKLTTSEQLANSKDEALHKTEIKAKVLARHSADVEDENGSVKAQFYSLLRFVALYLGIAWGLQLLGKAYPAVPLLGRISGVMLNPLRELEHKAAENFGRDMSGAVEDTKAWLAKEGYTPDELAKYESEVVHQWATIKDGTRAKFEEAKAVLGKI